ncbi:nuclear transport factor 2 family protein [Rugamonas apoptosis]|uniref:Nuclear transport factor 2 family protein n=1 Tax=Rugamonas apoptosis TaxID=2758570 RepID=A0A7W2IK05_9BURK|nr:nuclear transport factor 2 family protein [Rugamonas apoptosis]MBA5686821.1 nuclear transport factor 2 family protein [Rugamonas apoptosis]
MHKHALTLATSLTLLSLAGPPALAAEAQQRVVPTVTLTVKQFSELEEDWLQAVRQHDTDALNRLVADNFELRTSAAPGRPTARAAWLKQAQSGAPFESRIEQMAVHEYGPLMVVSFLWKLDVPKTSPLPQQVFVIDTWKQGDNGWQVVTRYAAPVQAGAKAVPGAEPGPPAVDKKI